MPLKAFRLFVSSTFSDFAEERDLLQSEVFPELDAYCTRKGYQFQAIDLRWGVNDEAQLDQRTAEICLAEVAAAQEYPPPNFLIMIANRYGWVPLPFAIAQDEFEAAMVWLAEQGREDDVRALGKVYRLDDNHLLAPSLTAATDGGHWIGAYTLRSREHDIRKLASSHVWKKLEAQVRGALQDGADHLLAKGLISETARAKFFLSLTEQEIAATLRDKATPGRIASSGAQAIAWIREDHGASDPGAEALKAKIRRALPAECVLSGHATRTWRGRSTTAYLLQFAARIKARLQSAIDAHIIRAEADEQSELLRERSHQKSFASDRRGVFFGRNATRAIIANYLTGEDAHPLVLFGPSGMGKSALMARAVGDAEEAGQSGAVVYRFVGASAASTDVRSLLVSILEDLAAHGVLSLPEQWKDDASLFDEQVRTLFMSINEPAAIFIDALDQLSKPHFFAWLPLELPPRLKLVVSVLNDENYQDDSGAYRALAESLPSSAFREIEPLSEHGHDILLALEESAQRRFRFEQRSYIIDRFKAAGGSPLYLRIAFEISRAWRSWDVVGKGRCVLAGNTAEVIAQLIAELSSVHHHEPELVARTLGYLAAAKNGLSRKEFAEILSRDRRIMAAISSERYGARARKLPDSVWVRLNRQLGPLLVEKLADEQPLLQFFHRQLSDIAREQYYAPAKIALHNTLADYFDAPSAARWHTAGPSATVYAKRTLSELPHHLFHGERTTRLSTILLAPDWMAQKLDASGVQALLADYEQFGEGAAQNAIGQTLRLISGILREDARELLPQLLDRLATAKDPTLRKFVVNAARKLARPAMRTALPSLTPPGSEVSRINGGSSPFTAIATLANGNLISAQRVARGDDWETHSIFQIWDPKTLRQISKHELPGYLVFQLAPLSSGGIAYNSRAGNISAGFETQIWSPQRGLTKRYQTGWPLLAPTENNVLLMASEKRWAIVDLASGSETIKEEENHVLALEGHHNGTAVLLFHDGSCKLCGLSSEATQRDLHGFPPGKRIRAAALAFPLAAVVTDNKLLVWDVATGRLALQEELESSPQLAVFVGAERLAVALASSVRVFDCKASATLCNLQGHTAAVRGVTHTREGLVVSAGRDGTIRFWNPNQASLSAEPARLKTRGIACVGETIVTNDKSAICIWDWRSGSIRSQTKVGDGEIVGMAAGEGPIVGIAMSDGSLLTWDIRKNCKVSAMASPKESRTNNKGTVALVYVGKGRFVHATALSFSVDGALYDGYGSVDIVRLSVWDSKTGNAAVLAYTHLPASSFFGSLSDGAVVGVGERRVEVWKVPEAWESICKQYGAGDIALETLRGIIERAEGIPGVKRKNVEEGARTPAARIMAHSDIAAAFAQLSPDRLLIAGTDRAVRMFGVSSGREITRLTLDHIVRWVAPVDAARVVCCDDFGVLHWLETVD